MPHVSRAHPIRATIALSFVPARLSFGPVLIDPVIAVKDRFIRCFPDRQSSNEADHYTKLDGSDGRCRKTRILLTISAGLRLGAVIP